MAEKKNILILTADAGFGHRSAANAIAAALNILYARRCDTTIFNPLDDKRIPAFLREVTQSDYDKIVRKMPDFYKLNYQLSDSPVPGAVLESALTGLLFTVIRSMVKEHQPDAIVTTHPFYMAPLNAYITLRKLPIPFLTVVTDLTNIHRLWFNQGSEYCLLPTQEAYDEAILAGLPPEVCRMTGIPVSPVFYTDKRSKTELRSALGWRPDLLTALVVGSKRTKNLRSVLHALNHSGFPIQLVLVAGGDSDLFGYLNATEWHVPCHIYNFVENMPEFMKAADFYIGKAGGLAVTESLACGLPLLLVDVTPGQEEGNLSYVLSHGSGEFAGDTIQALEVLNHWLDHDREVLSRRSSAAALLGKPKAAFEIADLAWLAAEKGRNVPSPRLMSWIPRFREILRSFEISDPTDN